MSNNFKKYKEEYENKYNEELHKTGVFWAFGNQQFDENKTHKEASNNEYRSIGFGGYIHESNLEKYRNFHNKIVPKLKKEFTDKINIDDLIEYELENHECYYTGDWQEIIDIIENYYTKKRYSRNEVIKHIEQVYKKNYNQKMAVFYNE